MEPPLHPLLESNDHPESKFLEESVDEDKYLTNAIILQFSQYITCTLTIAGSVRITAFSKTISGGGALVPTCCSCPATINLRL